MISTPNLGNTSEKSKTIERWRRKITSLKELSYDSGMARIKEQFITCQSIVVHPSRNSLDLYYLGEELCKLTLKAVKPATKKH